MFVIELVHLEYGGHRMIDEAIGKIVISVLHSDIILSGA